MVQISGQLTIIIRDIRSVDNVVIIRIEAECVISQREVDGVKERHKVLVVGRRSGRPVLHQVCDKVDVVP